MGAPKAAARIHVMCMNMLSAQIRTTIVTSNTELVCVHVYVIEAQEMNTCIWLCGCRSSPPLPSLSYPSPPNLHPPTFKLGPPMKRLNLFFYTPATPAAAPQETKSLFSLLKDSHTHTHTHSAHQNHGHTLLYYIHKPVWAKVRIRNGQSLQTRHQTLKLINGPHDEVKKTRWSSISPHWQMACTHHTWTCTPEWSSYLL